MCLVVRVVDGDLVDELLKTLANSPISWRTSIDNEPAKTGFEPWPINLAYKPINRGLNLLYMRIKREKGFFSGRQIFFAVKHVTAHIIICIGRG